MRLRGKRSSELLDRAPVRLGETAARLSFFFARRGSRNDIWRTSDIGVRRAKAALSSGCKPHPATAPAGSNRSSHVGNGVAEAGLQFVVTGNAVPAVPADLPLTDV